MNILSLNDEDYKYIEGIVKNKRTEYKDVKIVFYPVDLVEELRTRLEDPPSSILMMANGKVRLLNSIPYVVADVRKHSMKEIWERYKNGWRHPKVKEWVEEVSKNPKMVAKAFFLENLFLAIAIIQ